MCVDVIIVLTSYPRDQAVRSGLNDAKYVGPLWNRENLTAYLTRNSDNNLVSPSYQIRETCQVVKRSAYTN